MPEPSDVFPYTDPATCQPDLVVLRFTLPGDKTFRQISPDRGQWVCVGPEGLWPVFNRTRLRDATDAVVVEGENKVKARLDPAGRMGGDLFTWRRRQRQRRESRLATAGGQEGISLARFRRRRC